MNRKVQVIVFRRTPELEILVLHKTPESGGIWQPVTGKVEEGESDREGALRELMEETGISGESIRAVIEHVYSFDYTGKNGENHEEVFGVEVTPDTIVDMSKNVYVEHDKFEWVNPETAKKMIHWDTNRIALADLLKKV